jgi:nitroreductase
MNQLIANRRSPRAFTEQLITPEDLQKIFEAGSWAFSAFNAQPWRYQYAFRGTEGFNKILSGLMPQNQAWAKNASVLIVCLIENEINDQPNRWAQHDLGAANATMVLQALEMGIYGHLMAGFDVNTIVNALTIDTAKQTPIVCMALGYLGSPDQLEEPLRTRETAPRSRKAVSDFAASI